MPDYWAHRSFGGDVFLREEVQELIGGETEHAPWLWGLQGPDPLFFLSATGPAGGRMHRGAPEGMTAAMLRQLLTLPEGPARRTAAAWMAGFLCHYALDRTVHPYVLSQTEGMALRMPGARGNACHYQVETDMDIDLLLLAGQRMGQLDPGRGMALMPWQKEIIAGMLEAGAAEKGTVLPRTVIRRSMENMAAAQQLIFRGGRPVWGLARGLETVLGKRGQYTGHIKARRPRWDSLNLGRAGWMDPWRGETRRETVPELLGQAAEELLPMLRCLRKRLEAESAEPIPLGGLDFSGGPGEP